MKKFHERPFEPLKIPSPNFKFAQRWAEHPRRFRTSSQFLTHWEELLQSVSDFIFSKYYGYSSRGLKRSEKL